MDNEIQARTAPGRRMIEAAEKFSAAFADSAAANDREGRFPHEHIETLRDSGYLYGPLPEESGGWGVGSVHDVMVASSRLARGDAGITLGANMHLMTVFSYVRQREIAKARGHDKRAAALVAMMRGLVDEGVVIGAAVSEPNQNLVSASTRATKVGEGWQVTGRKIISSMAPAATHFSTSMNYTGDDGNEYLAFALVDRNAPGVTVMDDWDALGMRSSGSVTVVFDGAPLGERGPGKGMPAAEISAAYLETMFLSSPAHAAASLGVAEAAYAAGLASVESKRKRDGDEAVRSTLHHLAADSSIDLAASRGILSRALEMIDEHFVRFPTGFGDLASAHAVFSESQRAKSFISQAVVRIVDRAMTMTGGGAYMSGHPLARHWRDARAGAFMNPLAANLAHEYIGGVSLGLSPKTF